MILCAHIGRKTLLLFFAILYNDFSIMEENRRRPIRNFLIHKELQVPLMKSILVLVASSAFIAGGVLLAVYFYRSQTGYLYFMSNDFEKPLVRQSLLSLALPGLLFAEGVTLLIGFLIALSVSRKIAVPLYKLERWARAIAEGDLSVHLHFREKGQYTALMESCNAAGMRVRSALAELDRLLEDPALSDGKLPPESRAVIERARSVLSGWHFREGGQEPPP
jgi:hypothetical protein